MEWVLPINYFASGKIHNSSSSARSCDPPILASALTGGAGADIRFGMAKSLREQGSPSYWVSPLLCNIFPGTEKASGYVFRTVHVAKSVVNSQPILLNFSHNIWHSCFFVCFDILLPLAFGRQQCPPSFYSSLVSFFFTVSLLLSTCWRTQALAHFLSLGPFPSLSFLFPCVYSPFSILAHSLGW